MANLDALKGSGAYRQPSAVTTGPVEATVATSAASVTDRVDVLTPGATQRIGPCDWMPRVDDAGDLVLPQRGDACALVTTNQGRHILTWWQPAT